MTGIIRQKRTAPLLLALFIAACSEPEPSMSDWQVNTPGALSADYGQRDLGSPPDPKDGGVIEDIWQPAETPEGGISWSVLEGTEEIIRYDEEGIIFSRPIFSDEVRELEGKRIKVAGWMSVLAPLPTQDRFLLMGYPPGCPFHFHAKPNQFLEIVAEKPFPTDEKNVLVVTGVLELTGQNESGIFYKLTDVRPG